MALPSTNRTLHLDASDTDRLWRQTGMSSHPTNGQNVQAWDDEGDAVDTALFTASGADTDVPIYSTASFNGLSSLVFNGTDEHLEGWDDGWSTLRSLSTLTTTSAYTFFVSVMLDAASSSNDATTYGNEGILIGAGQVAGLHYKSNAGVHTLMAYNWDGNDDHADVTVSLSTKYVVMVKHVGGNISINVNNGALTASAASGNTSGGMGQVMLAKNGSLYAAIKVGEIAIYNADVTGTDLTDAWTYFMDKWVNAAGGATILRQMVQHHM